MQREVLNLGRSMPLYHCEIFLMLAECHFVCDLAVSIEGLGKVKNGLHHRGIVTYPVLIVGPSDK